MRFFMDFQITTLYVFFVANFTFEWLFLGVQHLMSFEI
jgi:hypothetical protein